MSRLQTEKSRSSIPSLTGIRGIAAVVVVAYHIPLRAMFELRFDVPLISQGAFGVDLFFILSGFILMYVHGREFHRITSSGLRNFVLLRFFRVYPLHATVLFVMLLFVLACPPFVPWFRSLPSPPYSSGVPYSVAGFFQTLTLTNRIGLPDLGEWNGPSWSLSSEILGYAAFPFLANRMTRVRSSLVCYAIAASSLACFCFVLFTRGHIGMPRMLFCFIAGIALGQAQQLQQGQSRWAALLTAAGTIVVVLSLATPATASLSVFGFAVLIYGLSVGNSLVGTLLETRPIMFLGRISFSLYLTHYLLLYVIEWAVWGGKAPTSHPILAACGYAGVCLAVATTLQYTIERPFHSLGRRLGHRSNSHPAQIDVGSQASPT